MEYFSTKNTNGINTIGIRTININNNINYIIQVEYDNINIIVYACRDPRIYTQVKRKDELKFLSNKYYLHPKHIIIQELENENKSRLTMEGKVRNNVNLALAKTKKKLRKDEPRQRWLNYDHNNKDVNSMTYSLEKPEKTEKLTLKRRRLTTKKTSNKPKF